MWSRGYRGHVVTVVTWSLLLEVPVSSGPHYQGLRGAVKEEKLPVQHLFQYELSLGKEGLSVIVGNLLQACYL